jgi:hypothetical protein
MRALILTVALTIFGIGIGWIIGEYFGYGAVPAYLAVSCSAAILCGFSVPSRAWVSAFGVNVGVVCGMAAATVRWRVSNGAAYGALTSQIMVGAAIMIVYAGLISLLAVLIKSVMAGDGVRKRKL